MALGLTADDMEEVNRLIDGLKEKNRVSSTAAQIRAETEQDDLKIRVRITRRSVYVILTFNK